VGDSRGDLAGGAEALFELEGGEHAPDQDVATVIESSSVTAAPNASSPSACPRAPQRFVRGLLDGDGPAKAGKDAQPARNIPALAVPQACRRGSSLLALQPAATPRRVHR